MTELQQSSEPGLFDHLAVPPGGDAGIREQKRVADIGALVIPFGMIVESFRDARTTAAGQVGAFATGS